MSQFLVEHWGDVASALGLAVALVGFAVTIYKTSKATSASEAARRAAEEVRRKLVTFDTITWLTEAISIMDEIKRLQRAEAWTFLTDRYAALRRLLIVIGRADTGLVESERSFIDHIVKSLNLDEHRIEKSIHTSAQPPSVTNLNKKMSAFMDRLTELLAEIRTRFGEHDHG